MRQLPPASLGMLNNTRHHHIAADFCDEVASILRMDLMNSILHMRPGLSALDRNAPIVTIGMLYCHFSPRKVVLGESNLGKRTKKDDDDDDDDDDDF